MKSLTLLLLLGALTTTAQAERIKDLASITGVRSNQLVGYGIVVGLNGTGDKVKSGDFTSQSLRSMLTQLGVKLPTSVQIKSKNIAAVMISASLPPFAVAGQNLNITVNAIGEASSLRGGTLLMSPLKGADGQVYAIAQGNLIVGGLSASGNDGSKVSVNIPTVGNVPNGATVEREVYSPFNEGSSLTLNLHTFDFTTANRLAMSINKAIGPQTSRTINGGSIKVNMPRDPSQRVAFMSLLENLEVQPAQSAARIIINSRTGTVVINSQVKVRAAAVSHGNLTVTISENLNVSQPGAFSDGETVVTPQSDITITEEDKRMFVFNPGVSLDEIVRAVNQVGAGPSDLVAILEALKGAGALTAELIVI
ncbi:MAG: flagellar biosynthesis protein FlgI [Cycloclasticus sp. symbiont of Bathymodiolus heckerae]|nr:MAG: flagellar biosynthesis protein FlgI [Cycloclasticus sp. symbiont of Bathymodiolus heckerae]